MTTRWLRPVKQAPKVNVVYNDYTSVPQKDQTAENSDKEDPDFIPDYEDDDLDAKYVPELEEDDEDDSEAQQSLGSDDSSASEDEEEEEALQKDMEKEEPLSDDPQEQEIRNEIIAREKTRQSRKRKKM